MLKLLKGIIFLMLLISISMIGLSGYGYLHSKMLEDKVNKMNDEKKIFDKSIRERIHKSYITIVEYETLREKYPYADGYMRNFNYCYENKYIEKDGEKYLIELDRLKLCQEKGIDEYKIRPEIEELFNNIDHYYDIYYKEYGIISDNTFMEYGARKNIELISTLLYIGLLGLTINTILGIVIYYADIKKSIFVSKIQENKEI